MSGIVNDGRVKQHLVEELESNDESLDDVALVRGRIGSRRERIRVEYLAGERHSRWRQHVAYTSDYVYYSVLKGSIKHRPQEKWGFRSKRARPGVDVPGPKDHMDYGHV
jgi:hypothetical protein